MFQSCDLKSVFWMTLSSVTLFVFHCDGDYYPCLLDSHKYNYIISIGTVNYSQKHGSRAGEASKTTGSGYRSALAPGCSLLTVDSIVYSDIVNTFKSSYLHSILSIAIIETPECQHCIVWQWTAFWSRGNGKFPTIKQRRFDFNLSGK